MPIFPFYTPLKTTENHTFSSVFTRHKKQHWPEADYKSKGTKHVVSKKEKKLLLIRITRKTSHEEAEAEISFRQATFWWTVKCVRPTDIYTTSVTYPEAYLEPSRTSTMKPICENSYRVLAAHRRCFIYNHFHNILRLFDVLTNFPFTTSETMRDYFL